MTSNSMLLACALNLLAATAWAATPGAAASAPKPTKASAAAAQAAAKKNEAKGLALATETAQRISEAQLSVADRVLTGDAACEFNQTVSVHPVQGHPGHFKLSFKKISYTMLPEETTTGAVRLEDKKAGVVWIQVPAKSMLLNAKIGQRMVDACLHPEQKAAVAAVEAAGKTLGIEPPSPPASSASAPSAASAPAN